MSSDNRDRLTRDLTVQKDELLAFTEAVETEFLALGKSLKNILETANQVRVRSDALIDAAAGRSEDAAIEFTFQLLKKSEDLAHSTREQFENVMSGFRNMDTTLRSIAADRRTLNRSLKELEVNRLLFRIEVAKLDASIQTDFLALAMSIDALLEDLKSGVSRRFEVLEYSSLVAQETARRLDRLSAEQNSGTQRILDSTRTHLAALHDALSAAEQIAARTSHAGERINQGASRAIVALQAQDMARQRLDHVRSAMDEMIRHLEARETAAGAPDGFLVRASEVQLKQLQAVSRQLLEAAGQVRDGLKEICADSDSLATCALDSGVQKTNQEVISLAVTSIHEVLSVVENATTGVMSVSEVVRNLKSAFGGYTLQVSQIRERLIITAVNAQIAASKVRNAATLGVISGSIGGCADRTMGALEGVIVRADDLIDSISELDHRLSDYGELTSMERAVLRQESTESEQRLLALEHTLATELRRIQSLNTDLSAAIEGTVGKIHFADRIREAMAGFAAPFEKIISESPGLDASAGGAAEAKVKQLKQNYTMADERSDHEEAIGSTETDLWSEEPDAPEPAATGGDNDGLAANVELF